MELALYIVGLILHGAVMFGALRAEIRALAAGVTEAKHETERANARIDQCQLVCLRGKVQT